MQLGMIASACIDETIVETRMQAHIFKGPGRVFAVTIDPAGANLPLRYAPWSAFKTIDLQKGVATPGLDVDECLSDLETYGLHLTDAHKRITEQALTQADALR